MRLYAIIPLLVCAVGLCAQTSEGPEVVRAKADMERLRSLVDKGVLPRAQLKKAEEAVADAQDAALLRKTVYGTDLTVEQSGDMIAAATRRFERRKLAFDDARKLVEAGVATELSLSSFLQDMELARKECDLAESRAKLTRELSDMAKAEEALELRLAQAPAEAPQVAERYDGDGVFTTVTFARVEVAYEEHFGKPLPISAIGETAAHRALGFDHTGRVDVAIHPDQPEGVWLREYLLENHIPFFAFRQAVPGKATGAHIHLGPISTKLVSGG